MKTATRFLTGLLAATTAVLLAALLGWTGQALAGSGHATAPPSDKTVVRVLGDRDGGYAVKRYDGSWIFPPPMSDALTACDHGDTRRARAKCHARTRMHYRDLNTLRAALAWAHQSS